MWSAGSVEISFFPPRDDEGARRAPERPSPGLTAKPVINQRSASLRHRIDDPADGLAELRISRMLTLICMLLTIEPL